MDDTKLVLIAEELVVAAIDVMEEYCIERRDAEQKCVDCPLCRVDHNCPINHLRNAKEVMATKHVGEE